MGDCQKFMGPVYQMTSVLRPLEGTFILTTEPLFCFCNKFVLAVNAEHKTTAQTVGEKDELASQNGLQSPSGEPGDLIDEPCVP